MGRWSLRHDLRIIHNNLVDPTSTTLAVSSTQTANTTSANLRNDTKSSVWRSGLRAANLGTAYIVVSFASTQVGGVGIPFSNLSPSATIRVRAYTGAVPTLGGTVNAPTFSAVGSTLVYDTGTIGACPNFPNASDASPGASNYAYGTSRYSRAWFDTNYTCTSVLIELIDSTPDRFFEISKLVVGSFWAPTYNTQFGLGVGFQELSSSFRMESGDLVNTVAPRYKLLSFDLKWLNDSDRQTLRQILQRNGITKSMFVSLFPQVDQISVGSSAEHDLEATYSVYGRLTQIQQLINSTFTMYSNSLELEEV